MSSNDVAIRVENLSKCYQIYEKPVDRLKQFVLPRFQRMFGLEPKQYYKEFWALKDVSFEVKKGETLGIIGRNGSGKSTLLQLICGTSNPSSGTVTTNGRVAAILELGSGFNPEFTGRENVYLNASLLGLSQQEVDERFDYIVAFADIGDFVEQPVKTYSSGMLVRLAFAVIAHVDADILVIDEALAVGDAVFTQKCMRFLREFMKNGTLLFVSHDSGSVKNLCQEALWLDKGVVSAAGKTEAVTKSYFQYCTQEIYTNDAKLIPLITNEKDLKGSDKIFRPKDKVDLDVAVSFFEDIENSDGWKTGAAEIKSVSILNSDGTPVRNFFGGEHLLLSIEAIVHRELHSPIIGFFVKDKLGQSLFGEHTFNHAPPEFKVNSGDVLKAEFWFDLPMLPNGDYSMTVSIAEGTPENHIQHHWLHEAMLINVESRKLRYGLIGIPFSSVSIKSIS